MATPYLQKIHEEVVSTQDLARADLGELPQVVIASAQTGGRGRTGSEWFNATRSLAVSVAWCPEHDDDRPFSLMAGVAAVRVLARRVDLKWPNDVMMGDDKVGGILVERSDESAVVGFGLNLFWPDAPGQMTALYADEPALDLYKEIGALWAAEILLLVRTPGWPMDVYRDNCQTLGRDITWEPNGHGLAAGIDSSGALLVDTEAGIREIFAGAIRHVRG